MQKLLKYKNWYMFALIVSLFFLDSTIGSIVSLLAIVLILVFNPGLKKMFMNLGFLIFTFIILGTPLIFDFSVDKIWSNTLILSRGILIVFWLFFAFRNIESTYVYKKISKYLPSELLSIIKISIKIFPSIKDRFSNELSDFNKSIMVPHKFIVKIFEIFVLAAEDLVKDLEFKEKRNIIIVTGQIHQGKTTLAHRIAKQNIENNLNVGGILSLGKWEDGNRSGFDVLNLANGDVRPLATINIINSPPELFGEKFGPYYFYNEGIEFAKQAIDSNNLKNKDVVFIDEIGKMELQDRGFATSLTNLLDSNIETIVIVMRENFIENIENKFNFKADKIIKVNDSQSEKDYLLNYMLISSTNS